MTNHIFQEVTSLARRLLLYQRRMSFDEVDGGNLMKPAVAYSVAAVAFFGIATYVNASVIDAQRKR